ncbi:MAG: 3D-(3,5/4)-trihydroxycyclohexane-1,2-dione acylhydrolase (decyclizing) [Solirubrobacteraceae bacterium]
MNDTTTAAAGRSGPGADTVVLTTAQALVRYVQAQYSERDGQVRRVIPAIFGIFGHGNVLGLGQAIQQEGLELPLYQPKNEQAMVHAAIGYAKASRRLATLACTASIGPGATNMLTGAATATVNRLPVLLLPGDTFANRRQGPVLQQLEHRSYADVTVNDAFRPVSRFFDRIARPEQLLTALPEAMRVLLDPAETGAVTISLHQDVQGEAFAFPTRFFDRRVWPVTRRPVAPAELEAAAAAIRSSSRPLLIAGGGVRYAAAELALRKFADELSIPVAETSAGKGALTDSEWLLGGLGVNGSRTANELAREADLVLCVGTRLSDFTTSSHSLFANPDVEFVSVNVNAADAAKLSATPVVADAREALDALRLELGSVTREPYLREIDDRRGRWEAELDLALAPQPGGLLTQGEVLRTVNEDVRSGDWIVAAAGYQPGDLLKLWRTPPGTFTHIEFGFSCMGHEIPAAIGIRLREGPRAEVLVAIGDGTYLMSPTELFTAVQEGLKITVVILDNGGYQSINHLAIGNAGVGVGNEFRARGVDGRLPDGDRVPMDFVANAESMGCRAVAVANVDELGRALEEARLGERSTVIVCSTAPDRPLPASGAFWDLGTPEVADDSTTRRLAAEHRARGGGQRHY